LHPARGLDDAVAATQPAADETHLYAALREALARSPAAIACLTDGLDTTTDDATALVAEAQRRGVPLYFAVGQNRLRSGEMLNIREIKAPPRVLRRTEFTASTLIEVAGTTEVDVPVELWSGAEKLASTSLPMRPGRNTVAWPVTVSAREPGAMPLEFRVGAGERQQVAACTTQVVEREKVDVLYYQGALQWGYRYLLAALESDPSFHLESILNPALGCTSARARAARPRSWICRKMPTSCGVSRSSCSRMSSPTDSRRGSRRRSSNMKARAAPCSSLRRTPRR